MKRTIYFLLIICLACVNASFAQQPNELKTFEISAAAHGFMCPFLTPKYIQRIEKLDSCKVWQTDDLVIHVNFLKPTEVNEDLLINAAEKTGYEKKNITVKKL